MTSSLNPRIIDTLYAETLVLADEVRAQFDRSRHDGAVTGADDLARVALSCEALRTTTRVMHCLAWLHNHRAFFAGELSEQQLRRHGRLAPAVPPADPENCALLSPEMVLLVRESERIHARIARIERAWRGAGKSPGEAPEGATIAELRERLAGALR